MDFTFLSSFTSLIKLMGDIFPSRMQVGVGEVGVKQKHMKEVSILREGNHWYWPLVSHLEVESIRERAIQLPPQYCDTKDGKTVYVDGAIIAKPVDSDADLEKLFLETEEWEEVLAAIGMAAINDYIARSSYEDLLDRDDLNERVLAAVDEDYRRHGVEASIAIIESMASGRTLVHMGSLMG